MKYISDLLTLILIIIFVFLLFLTVIPTGSSSSSSYTPTGSSSSSSYTPSRNKYGLTRYQENVRWTHSNMTWEEYNRRYPDAKKYNK